MISLAWQLGFTDVVLPLLFWVPLFLVAALVLNLFVVRWCRARLRASGKKTGGATVLLALLLLVLTPVASGCLGATFSLQRSVGAVMEDAGAKLSEKLADLGAPVAKRLLDVRSDDQLVDLGAARAKLHTRLAEPSGHSLLAIPHLLETAYLGAVDLATYTFPTSKEVRWRDLADRGGIPLALPGNQLLAHYTSTFYANARVLLYLTLFGLFALDALAMAVVHLLARRPAPPVEPAARAAA